MLILPLQQLINTLRISNTCVIKRIETDIRTFNISSPLAFCITKDYNKNNKGYHIYLLDIFGLKVIGETQLKGIKGNQGIGVGFTRDYKGINGVYNFYTDKDYLPLDTFIQKSITIEGTLSINTLLDNWYLQFISTREMYLRLFNFLMFGINFLPYIYILLKIKKVFIILK